MECMILSSSWLLYTIMPSKTEYHKLQIFFSASCSLKKPHHNLVVINDSREELTADCLLIIWWISVCMGCDVRWVIKTSSVSLCDTRQLYRQDCGGVPANIVYDAGPTLNQEWLNVSRLLGSDFQACSSLFLVKNSTMISYPFSAGTHNICIQMKRKELTKTFWWLQLKTPSVILISINIIGFFF